MRDRVPLLCAWLTGHSLDAPFDVGEVIEQLFEQHPHGGGQDILRIAQMPTDVDMKAASADARRQSISEAEGSRLVDQSRPLADEPVADAMEGLQIDLLGCANLDKAHRGRVTASATAAASTVSVLFNLT